MVDAEVSKTSDASRASSSLASGTSFSKHLPKLRHLPAHTGRWILGLIRRGMAAIKRHLAKMAGHSPDWCKG